MANTIIKVPLLQSEVIRLLDRKAKVLPWANTQYEGQLRQQGDTVTVQTFPNIAWTETSGTAAAGADIAETNFAITSENLTIDGTKQVNVPITDLEKVQSNLPLETLVADRLAYDLAIKSDNDVIKLAIDGALAANKLGDATTVLSKTNIFEAVESMAVALKNQNVEVSGTPLFVSPEIASLLRQSGLLDNVDEGLKKRINGVFGMISGFMVIETTATQIKGSSTPGGFMVALTKESVNYVQQLVKMKRTEATNAFKSNILGEVVKGGKVFAEPSKTICTYNYKVV